MIAGSVPTTLKSITLGIGLGLIPVLACALLYYFAPLLVKSNPGELLSFAVIGCYAMSSLAVFIIAMILIIIKNKPMVGGVALLVMIAQLIFGISSAV
jgi:hypothetical protein